MIYRDFGKTGLKTSLLGFGCSALLSRASRRESLHALDQALAEGINLFDTSPSYGQGDSERLLGERLAGKRQKVILVSKAGIAYTSALRRLNWIKPVVRPFVRRLKSVKRAAGQMVAKQSSFDNFDPPFLQKALDESLKRLRTDFLDVYLLHNPPLKVLEKREALEVLSTAKRAGKVRHFGISCNTEEEALSALKNSELSVLQIELNWLYQWSIPRVLPLCVRQGIAVMARSPFAGGGIFFPQFKPPVPGPRADAALKFAGQQAGVSVLLASMIGPDHLNENVRLVEKLFQS